MKRSLVLLLGTLVATSACNLDTPSNPIVNVVAIDCATFATSLAANASTLTTLSTGVQYRDVTVGAGSVVTSGSAISVRYSGCLTTGSQFDTNVAQTSPLQFIVGTSGIIAGFNDGIVGARVGGRRQLVIPPARGYGSVAQVGIPANSTIVFTVDIISSP